jgi:hypothetical protein
VRIVAPDGSVSFTVNAIAGVIAVAANSLVVNIAAHSRIKSGFMRGSPDVGA